jgi:penicillin amidase
VTWNENVIAADSAGNIGYWHPGLFQVRPSQWDQRLPLPGTGEAEWSGLVPREKLPHVINPRQGWLANWNNIPSQGWTSGDGVASERLTGTYHRVGWLTRLVANLAKDPTWEGLRETVRLEGTIAQQRPMAGPALRRAARGADGPAKAVLDAVLAWDGDYTRVDDAATIDPGASAWQQLERQVAAAATAPLGDGAKLFEDRAGTSHVYDMTDKQAYGFRTLDAAGMRKAAAQAFDVLKDRFGTDDVTRWRAPREMYKVGAQGAGSAPPLPFFDRGTYEQLVELAP